MKNKKSESRFALIAQNTPTEFVNILKANYYNILYGTVCENVPKPVSKHIDTQIGCAGNNEYVCCPECYEYYNKLFNKDNNLEIKLICGEKHLSNVYPYDIAYNVAVLNNYAFGAFEYVDKILINRLIKNGKKLVDVRQGYAKCSICTVDGNSIITSDCGLYNTICKNCPDVDTLHIKTDKVFLEGYNYGFIGGTSGCDESCVFFCGDVSKHADYNKIAQFIHSKSKKIISSKNKLNDIGTIFILG